MFSSCVFNRWWVWLGRILNHPFGPSDRESERIEEREREKKRERERERERPPDRPTDRPTDRERETGRAPTDRPTKTVQPTVDPKGSPELSESARESSACPSTPLKYAIRGVPSLLLLLSSTRSNDGTPPMHKKHNVKVETDPFEFAGQVP